MKKLLLYIILFLNFGILSSQVEYIHISDPVYKYLERAQTKGLLEYFSLSDLPLQKYQIVNALEEIRKQETKLSNSEKEVLEYFENKYTIINPSNRSVVIYSDSDTNQVFFSNLFNNSNKFIYHYQDSSHNFSFEPLASLEAKVKDDGSEVRNSSWGNLGFRMRGTLSSLLGYNLQVTNGVLISGDKDLLLEERNLQQNIKFAELNSDFDFSESSLVFQKDWFIASIGRMSRLMGSGLDQRIFMSTNAPPIDAMSLGVRFKTFEYKYIHGSLLGIPSSTNRFGVDAVIPSKYMAVHRFSVRPSWGEFSFWENIIYSDRSYDLAYLNPLSFFKSLEHALRDRDNSIMGFDFTIRPVDNLEMKGTYLLDDIKFGEIGTGYWSNKSAWNIALLSSHINNFDIGTEYSRIEPYTFSHFNPQNSMTNDMRVYGSYLLPNSDQLSMKFRYWWGNPYPIEVKFSYMRHGDNIYDEEGNLVRNVGGDPMQAYRGPNLPEGFPGDSYTVEFLDGDLEEIFRFQLSGGFDIFNGFNLLGAYTLENRNGNANNIFKIQLRYNHF